MNVPHNTVTAETKAAVLAEVLPYIRRFAGSVFVVKYGGNAMTEQHLKEGFAKDITLLKLVGIHPVIVHGGGPQINEMLEKIGKKGEFVQGMRVTDDETMSIVEMVLGGLVNKEIVSLLNQSGAKAVGITGRDNHFIKAEKLLIDTPEQTQADIGRVGTVESIDTALITGIIERGCIPVVAPIGVGKDGGAFNINADLVAGKLAEELKAENRLRHRSGLQRRRRSPHHRRTRSQRPPAGSVYRRGRRLHDSGARRIKTLFFQTAFVASKKAV